MPKPRPWPFFPCLLALATLAAPADAADRPPAPLGGTPFLWGVTTSSYQNEGPHPAMDWAQADAAGLTGEKVGKGSDFRAHLEDDLDRAASIGLNAFRTSIEWARIEPEEGRIDAAEVAYVHRLLAAIRKRGMTPIVTLHHFATPAWANADPGDGTVGWENARIIPRWLAWVDFAAREFGPQVDHWLTFNEPSSIIIGGYGAAKIPPYRSGPVSAAKCTANLLAAHEAAYDVLHARDPGCMVSVPDFNCLLPGGVSWTPGRWFTQGLAPARGWDGRDRPRTLDFTAVHFYGVNNAFTEFPTRPERWGGKPEMLTDLLSAYYQAFGLPILIAENGMATRDGAARPDGWTPENWLVAHARAIEAAQRRGVPVMGYMYWTLTDNYEWGQYGARFGLWRVEAAKGDYARHETPAVAVYRELVKHGVTPDLLAKYPAPN